MKIGLSYNIKEAQLNPYLPADAMEEFDSPGTISSIRDVLEGLGHEVVLLGFGRSALEKILSDRIDFVFNIAEGFCGRSREALMPALFELLDIPYSGPDPFTACVSLDKIAAKKIAAEAGISTPAHVVAFDNASFPVIMKPAWEGSSKGIRSSSKINNHSDFIKHFERLKKNYPPQPIIAEEFIDGREFTVGVLGNKSPSVLGIMEIAPKDRNIENFIYSLEVKRDYKNQVDYYCPPELEKPLREKLETAALILYKAFGCRDAARFDFRMDKKGQLYFLEVNTLPGLNPVSSDLVIMAKFAGISYDELIIKIFNYALERYKLQICKSTI